MNVKKIFLIGNPVAGREALRKIQEAVSILEGKNVDVTTLLTIRRGDAETFAMQVVNKAEDGILVLAAGGDGTYNEIANGLAYSGVPMAILPVGTTSVLAKELRIPFDIKKAVDIALDGHSQTVHMGRIDLGHQTVPLEKSLALSDLSESTRYFLLMAGIGFDAETVFNVSRNIKRKTGKTAYILSAAKTLINYNPASIRIACNGEVIKGCQSPLKGYSAVIGNASCYGGRFHVTPDAKITDPFFYGVLMRGNSKTDILRYIIGMLTGRHINFGDISYFKASEIMIEGNSPVQIDGDYIGTGPARIDVAVDSLRIVIAGKSPAT